MKAKDKLKVVGATTLTGAVFLLLLLYGAFVLQTAYGVLMSMMLGFILLILIFYFCYPIWFKDYIEEFWKKREEKLNEEKEIN